MLLRRLSVSDKMFQGMVELAVGDLAVAVARRRKCSPAEALKEVYHSDFYKLLLNPKSGLYFEGKAALIDLFMRQSRLRGSKSARRVVVK